jgi:hypothetical protein
MSNWEARQLSARQVQYAALDAIITGHIFRGLRLWHASPSACTSCRQMLGAVSDAAAAAAVACACLHPRCVAYMHCTLCCVHCTTHSAAEAASRHFF